MEEHWLDGDYLALAPTSGLWLVEIVVEMIVKMMIEIQKEVWFTE